MRFTSKRFGSAWQVIQSLALTLVFAAPYSVSAADFNVQTFPVPIRVEGERVRSSMFLQFEIERYGLPMDAFAKRRLDNFEMTFLSFMQALRSGDVAKVMVLRPGEKSEQVQEIVNRYHEAFAGPQMVTVVGRVGVGTSQLFVWEWPAQKGRMRRGFIVDVLPNGAMRVEIAYSGRPLETLIVDILQQEVAHPIDYAVVEPRARYHYTFPLMDLGTPGAHAVVLHFNGEPLNLQLLSNDTTTGEAPNETSINSPLKTYREAYRALKDRNLEQFWDSYAQKSRDKLRTWLEKTKPDEFNAFYATATAPRTLRFLLDADPVLLTFYTKGSEKRLRYEYLLKVGDTYKLANAYAEGFLDDVLGNEMLFPTTFDSFLKNVLGQQIP
jgi:hypothetical protein